MSNVSMPYSEPVRQSVKQTVRRGIRRMVKRCFFPEMLQDSPPLSLPFGLPNLPKVYVRRFGERNPDRTFYVIWRDRLGSGFFSNLTQVISHLILAENHGWIPVVDYQNFRTIYQERSPVNGTANAWEYYFKPLSPYSLEEVYSSRNVLFADGTACPPFPCRSNREYRSILKRYIHLQDSVAKEFSEFRKMLENTFVLGIHFRGKEMNTTPGHPFAPTVRQMTTWTDRILENHPVEKIFFSSEEKDYLDLFVKRYGKRLLFLPVFRASKVNAYNLNPRPLHRHLLGKEALLDSLMLSCCDILLCGKSGITSNAVRSSRRLKLVYTIHNGYNSRNLLAAKFLYRLKKHLPPGAGGLRNEVVISRYPEMEDTLYEPV